MEEDTDKTIYNCEECGVYYHHPDATHENLHGVIYEYNTGELTFSCQIENCPDKLKSGDTVQIYKHLLNHNYYNEEEKEHKCTQCHSFFDEYIPYSYHMNYHIPNGFLVNPRIVSKFDDDYFIHELTNAPVRKYKSAKNTYDNRHIYYRPIVKKNIKEINNIDYIKDLNRKVERYRKSRPLEAVSSTSKTRFPTRQEATSSSSRPIGYTLPIRQEAVSSSDRPPIFRPPIRQEAVSSSNRLPPIRQAVSSSDRPSLYRPPIRQEAMSSSDRPPQKGVITDADIRFVFNPDHENLQEFKSIFDRVYNSITYKDTIKGIFRSRRYTPNQIRFFNARFDKIVNDMIKKINETAILKESMFNTVEEIELYYLQLLRTNRLIDLNENLNDQPEALKALRNIIIDKIKSIMIDEEGVQYPGIATYIADIIFYVKGSPKNYKVLLTYIENYRKNFINKIKSLGTLSEADKINMEDIDVKNAIDFMVEMQIKKKEEETRYKNAIDVIAEMERQRREANTSVGKKRKRNPKNDYGRPKSRSKSKSKRMSKIRNRSRSKSKKRSRSKRRRRSNRNN